MAVDIARHIDIEGQLPYAGRLVEGTGNPDGGPAIIGRSREQFGYGYYRKAEREKDGVPDGDSGWIRLEQDCSTNRVMYIDQPENDGFGWTYLGRYGRFFQGKPFDFRTNQFAGILECGGEHEFPVSQIIELGWHRRPPRYLGLTDYSRPMRGQPVAFPQLQALDPATLKDVQCSICGQRMRPEGYGGKDDLVRHETIFHSKQSANHDMARTLSTEMGKVAQQIQTGGEAAVTPQLLETMTAILKQNQELLARFMGPEVAEPKSTQQPAAPQKRRTRAATEAPASAPAQHGSFADALRGSEGED